MGLDTVELIVRIESYFGISIANSEAEKIFTIQDLADTVSTLVVITPAEESKSQRLLMKIKRHLIDTYHFNEAQVQPETSLRELMNNDSMMFRERLEKHLNLELPILTDIDVNTSRDRMIMGIKIRGKEKRLTIATIKDLVRWTLAINHEKLINPESLTGKEDVEHIVLGIVSDSVGIPVNEIKMNDSITGDLGID